MANISTWSTTAASNNAVPPDGAPEGMAPSAVNNTMRETMASVRTWYEDAEWTDFGYTHVYVAATQFKIAGTDYTGEYHVGRRVRVVADTPSTIYGTITATSFSTDTTVTVAFDSGSLSNEALTVSLSALSSNSASAVPGVKLSGDDWTIQGDLEVTGTITEGGTGLAKTVTTTRGDLVRRGASADERVALGTSGQAVKSDGTDAVWDWTGVVQVVSSQDGTAASTATVVPVDDVAAPQITEGAEFITQAITPKSTNHTLIIDVVIYQGTSSTANVGTIALFQDSNADAICVGTANPPAANVLNPIMMQHVMTAPSTSAITFKVRYGPSAGTMYVNTRGGTAVFSGLLSSRITITEIAD